MREFFKQVSVSKKLVHHKPRPLFLNFLDLPLMMTAVQKKISSAIYEKKTLTWAYILGLLGAVDSRKAISRRTVPPYTGYVYRYVPL